MTLLSVDIGTTHVKACAYDEDGSFLGAAHRGTPTRRPREGGAEYEAHALITISKRIDDADDDTTARYRRSLSTPDS